MSSHGYVVFYNFCGNVTIGYDKIIHMEQRASANASKSKSKDKGGVYMPLQRPQLLLMVYVVLLEYYEYVLYLFRYYIFLVGKFLLYDHSAQ